MGIKNLSHEVKVKIKNDVRQALELRVAPKCDDDGGMLGDFNK